jgi:hypothetical protein
MDSNSTHLWLPSLSGRAALVRKPRGSGVVFGQRNTLWKTPSPKTTPDPFFRNDSDLFADPGRR